MALEQPIVLRIVAVLEPFMHDPEDRESNTRVALWGCPVLGDIRWNGAARNFLLFS
jgi:hypothetical protein